MCPGGFAAILPHRNVVNPKRARGELQLAMAARIRSAVFLWLLQHHQSRIRHTPHRLISLCIASGARSAPLGHVIAPQSR